MLYSQFIEQLKNNFFPVIVIEGDDAFLREDALEKISDSLNIILPELNVTVRDGQDVSVTEIVALANSFPAMSEKRLIVLKNFLSDKKNISNKDKNVIKFSEYCAQPNESTCLVLFYSTSECPLKLNATYVDCNKKDVYAVADWISKSVEKEGKIIERSLARKIAEYCNCDMYNVFQSVNKLLAYCEREVTAEAIELLVQKDVEVVVFDLSNAICAGQPARALEICRKLLTEEEPGKIMGSIYSGFRRMFFVSSSNLTDERLAEKLGVKPYAVKKAREQSNKFGAKRLKSALLLCADSDAKLKNFNGNEKAIINDLVMALCNLGS